MSIVTAIHGGNAQPVWSAWEGAPVDAPDQGFAWIDVVDARGDEIGALQRAFGLHELAVEDSMGDAPLAKIDFYPDYVFITAKAAELGGKEIEFTDVSIFLAEKRIITVCRMETKFGERLRNSIERIAAREIKSPEYVVHEVLDLIVDNYFSVVQKIAGEVLAMEQRLLDSSLSRDEIARIFELRRETIHFQYVLTKMTEVCNKLATLDIHCVSNEARPYFRDVLDNLVRIEAMSSGLIDVIRAALEASSLLEQQRQSDITRKLAAWAGKGQSGWWEWSDTKRMLEWLFWAGHISTATRRGNFERVYDLIERVIPADVLARPTPTDADAHRGLIERAAVAHGIATSRDLRDYFRQSPDAATTAIKELTEEGVLIPVEVPGWRHAWLHREARRPRKIEARALLAPFDPLIWTRDRAEQLFGFRYRIEIYVPAEKRQHGYYVLPFLLGDRLVARVDLKADRQASRLLVRSIHLEPDAPDHTLEALEAELLSVAHWLGLRDADMPDPLAEGVTTRDLAAKSQYSPVGGCLASRTSL